MSLKLLLTLSGGLEALTGVLALIVPALVVSVLLGGQADANGLVLARLLGAGIFGLGLACLKARDDVRSEAGLAITYAITLYNVLATVLLVWAVAGLGLGGPVLWAAGIGHALFSALFVHALVVPR